MSPEYAPTGVAGHAWLATDENCALHYLIALSGLKEYNTITALLSGKYSSSNNDIYTIIISNFVHGKVGTLYVSYELVMVDFSCQL